MTKQKSLGQIAYEEAIRGPTNRNCPTYANLPRTSRTSYSRMAQAVAREVKRRLKAEQKK